MRRIFGTIVLVAACAQRVEHKNGAATDLTADPAADTSADPDVAHIRSLFLDLANDPSSDPDTVKLATAIGKDASDEEISAYLQSGHVQAASELVKDEKDAPALLKSDATQAVGITMITLGSLVLARIASYGVKYGVKYGLRAAILGGWPDFATGDVSRLGRKVGLGKTSNYGAKIAIVAIATSAIYFGSQLLEEADDSTKKSAEGVILSAGVLAMLLGLNHLFWILPTFKKDLQLLEEWTLEDEALKWAVKNNREKFERAHPEVAQQIRQKAEEIVKKGSADLKSKYPEDWVADTLAEVQMYRYEILEEKLEEKFFWQFIPHAERPARYAIYLAKVANSKKPYLDEFKKAGEYGRRHKWHRTQSMKWAAARGGWAVVGTALGAVAVAVSQTTLNLTAEVPAGAKKVLELNAAIKAYLAKHPQQE